MWRDATDVSAGLDIVRSPVSRSLPHRVNPPPLRLLKNQLVRSCRGPRDIEPPLADLLHDYQYSANGTGRGNRAEALGSLSLLRLARRQTYRHPPGIARPNVGPHQAYRQALLLGVPSRIRSRFPWRNGYGRATLNMTQFAPRHECLSCAVRTKAVLCDVGEEELCAFRGMTHVLRYGPRETVFYEGHPSLGLYLLCEGKAKLTRTAVTGQRQIVELLDAGDVIETHALTERLTHESTCLTLEPSRICLIEREPYQALLKRNSALTFKLIHLLGLTVARQMARLEWLTSLDARQRLAGLLLELNKRFGSGTNATVAFNLSLTREELAELIGVAVETAIRLLSSFRCEGLVQVTGRRIRVLNHERLSRIARV